MSKWFFAVLVVALLNSQVLFAEKTTAKIGRLSKLAAQAFASKQISRGESYLNQALETAQNHVNSHRPQSFGEYPHILRAYIHLLKKRIGVYAARKNHRQAIATGTEGLTTLESVVSQLSDENLAPLKDVSEAYFHVLERVVLSEMSRGGEEKAVILMEKGMDIYEQLLSQIRNRLALGMIVKKYLDLAKKLVKYYQSLGRKDYALQVVERAHNKISYALGADHATTKTLEKHREVMRNQ
mgnify:FL=1